MKQSNLWKENLEQELIFYSPFWPSLTAVVWHSKVRFFPDSQEDGMKYKQSYGKTSICWLSSVWLQRRYLNVFCSALGAKMRMLTRMHAQLTLMSHCNSSHIPTGILSTESVRPFKTDSTAISRRVSGIESRVNMFYNIEYVIDKWPHLIRK